jgi:hypothetical protein
LLDYARLAKKPYDFRSFTGLDVSEFDSLYKRIEPEYEQAERERLSRPDKKRAVGGGRKFSLSVKDRLLMLLLYYRLYTAYTLAGYLFDLDQSNICRDIHYIEPLVRKCVPIPKKIHNLTRRLRTLEEVKEYFPELRAYIDAAEQEIPRPKNKLKRKTHYSGKKKKHTVKTQMTVSSPSGLIVRKTNHARGRRHDYDVFKQSHPDLPEGVRPGVDLGYEDIQNDFPAMEPIIPFKKKSGGRYSKGKKARPLTAAQKLFNRELSKTRVVVEHAFSRAKKFNIFGQEFRNRLKPYDLMTDIASGLVNFRILGNKGLFL